MLPLPASILRQLHEPPTVRPARDAPVAAVPSPRPSLLRALVARLRARPTG